MFVSLEQLLSDDNFRKHVLNPNQEGSEFWESWINESPLNKKMYEEAAYLIRGFYEPLSPEEFQSEAIRFKRSIDVTSADKEDIIDLYETRRPKNNFRIYKIAASIVLFISTLFFLSWFLLENGSLNFSESNISEYLMEKEAARGQKLTLSFKDGTRVKLNSESYISYPEEFKDDIREVTLYGEAFFEVSHNADWPFIVNTKNAKIRVLGTSFNVNSFDQEGNVKVALVDGKVEIDIDDNSSVALEPMEMAVINENQKVTIEEFNIDKITAWKDNKIIFDKATFDEVQVVLERWFNVNFIYDEKPVFIGGYTGEFTHQSLSNILEGMGTGKFNYVIKGNNIYIN